MLNLRPKITLHDHPMADQISVQNTEYHYCIPGESFEIAFFKNGEWVTDLLPPFEEYADGPAPFDALVYAYVPAALLNEFLDKYAECECDLDHTIGS